MNYNTSNKVTLSSSALITSITDRITSGGYRQRFTGINTLDRVATLEISGRKAKKFLDLREERLQPQSSFFAPALEEEGYPMSGVMNGGAEVQFYKNGQVETATAVVMSSQQTLWSGHPLCFVGSSRLSPKQTFNLIGVDVLPALNRVL